MEQTVDSISIRRSREVEQEVECTRLLKSAVVIVVE